MSKSSVHTMGGGEGELWKSKKAKPRKDGTVSLLGKGEEDEVVTPEGDDKERITFKQNADGSFVIGDGADATVFEAPKSDVQQEGEKILKGAKAFLAELKAKPKATVHRCVVNDVEWLFRPFSGIEVAAIGMTMSRRDGGLDIEDSGFIAELVTHCLHRFFVADEEATEPLFDSYNDAKEFVFSEHVGLEPMLLLHELVGVKEDFFEQLQSV